jgi:hypothetical protein
MSGCLLASETIGSKPHLRFIPVMVTRLMLSLKKAAASQQEWNFGEPTTHTAMRFAERRGGVSTRDEIHLDIFASTHEGTQSRAMMMMQKGITGGIVPPFHFIYLGDLTA